MKAILEIEAIGDGNDQQIKLYSRVANLAAPGLGGYFKCPASYFVAQIIGRDPKYKWSRIFLRGKKDYSRSNSKGTRGVYIYYELESGSVYDVKKPVSWKNTDRFFCFVDDDGNINRIEENEIEKCLKRNILE